MRKGKNSLLKIVCATSMAIFSLLVAFTGTFAWFTTVSNRNSTTEYFSVEGDMGIKRVNYELYKYDQDKKTGIVLTEEEAKRDLSLNKFDGYILERNAQNNNILRFELDFSVNENTVSSTDVKITVHSQSSNIDDVYSSTGKMIDTVSYKYTKEIENVNGTYICNNISNVIKFKSFVYSTTKNGITTKYLENSCAFDETNANAIYHGASAAFLNSSNVSVSTFVVDSNKSTELELRNTVAGGNFESAVIYVEYNYDERLISSFLNNTEFIKASQIGSFDPNGKAFDFHKDIESIVITNEAK